MSLSCLFIYLPIRNSYIKYRSFYINKCKAKAEKRRKPNRNCLANSYYLKYFFLSTYNDKSKNYYGLLNNDFKFLEHACLTYLSFFIYISNCGLIENIILHFIYPNLTHQI